MKIKRLLSLCVVALTSAALLGGCKIGDREVYFASRVSSSEVFKIGNLSCKENEAYVYIANAANLYGTVYSTSLWSEEFDTEVMSGSIKDTVINHLSRVYALCAYAEDQDITLTKEEKDSCANAAKEYYDSLSSADKRYVDASRGDIEEMYQNYALAEKVYSKLMESVDEEVTEDEARVMEARIIYTTDKDIAENINGQLAYGASFERLQSMYNQADEANVTFGRGTYDDAVEKVAFSLEDDEVSDMIEGEDGYYFFECINKYNKELSAQNEQDIIAERKLKATSKVINDIPEDRFAEFNDKLWDKIEMPTDKVTTKTFFVTLDKYVQY